MSEQTWQDRFKRAIADYVGVPGDVSLADISIQESSGDGYRYSSYTFEDPNISITVRWKQFGKLDGFKYINGPAEVGKLIASFLPPG